MSRNRNILITGTTRGIGRALTALWLSKPNNTVIAAVRNPEDSAAKSLLELPAGLNSKVIVVKIDSTKQADAGAAVEELKSKHGIEHLDIVVANAGVSWSMPKIVELEVPELLRHLEVNNFGVIWLFQATISLLEKAENPKWVSMSSTAGTLGDMGKMVHNNAAYGASKAMLNFHTLKMHFEHENMAVIAIHPGWISTELGDAGAVLLGYGEKAPQTPEETLPGVFSIVEDMTRETHGGKLWSFDGSVILW